MANSYPLDLVATPQVVPLAGSPGPFHNIILAFDAAPTAGTALIEYRNLADPTWKPLSHANGITVTGNFFQARLDGSVAALRITFTGLVGGAGARIWDDISAQPSGLYAGSAALITQPYTEANVKNGVQYYLRAAWPTADPIAVGAVAARKLWFKTGPLPVIVKLRDLTYIAEELSLQLFSAPAGVSGGTDLVIHNYNGVNPVTAVGVQAKKNVTTTANGTEFDGGDPEYFFGSSSSANRAQSSIPIGRERILPPNSEFLVVLTNLSSGGGAAARAQYFLDFYVGNPDLPI
jgi:hypothetical protein